MFGRAWGTLRLGAGRFVSKGVEQVVACVRQDMGHRAYMARLLVSTSFMSITRRDRLSVQSNNTHPYLFTLFKCMGVRHVEN